MQIVFPPRRMAHILHTVVFRLCRQLIARVVFAPLSLSPTSISIQFFIAASRGLILQTWYFSCLNSYILFMQSFTLYLLDEFRASTHEPCTLVYSS